MRELPVKMPPMTLDRRGGTVREIVFFVIAFAAVFGAALILFDLASS